MHRHNTYLNFSENDQPCTRLLWTQSILVPFSWRKLNLSCATHLCHWVAWNSGRASLHPQPPRRWPPIDKATPKWINRRRITRGPTVKRTRGGVHCNPGTAWATPCDRPTVPWTGKKWSPTIVPWHAGQQNSKQEIWCRRQKIWWSMCGETRAMLRETGLGKKREVVTGKEAVVLEVGKGGSWWWWDVVVDVGGSWKGNRKEEGPRFLRRPKQTFRWLWSGVNCKGMWLMYIYLLDDGSIFWSIGYYLLIFIQITTR